MSQKNEDLVYTAADEAIFVQLVKKHVPFNTYVVE